MRGIALKFTGYRVVGFLWIGLSIFSVAAMAQTTTGAILGSVKDGTGAVLSGAEVTALNTARGEKRSTSTNEQGRFLLPELPSGSYEITVTMAGFDTLIRTGITLAVGQQAILTLPMTVGAVNQQVTVTGEAPMVNTTEGAVSGLVEEQRIKDLPLNGRDFTQLALVEPAVMSVRNTSAAPNKGFGTRISIAGSRPDQTGWLLDGMNIKSFSGFGTPASASGLLLGVDAVREFQVLTTNYSTEFGGTSGGVINMVTKSGTNGLHGSAYEFMRNNVLDARNFFDIQKPPFKRNQFGFSVGGPIRKDKTFFFGNFEELKAPLGLTSKAFVPDANVREGLIPAAGGTLQRVPIAPEIAPYLKIWPLPNGPASGPNSGAGTLLSSANQRTSEYYFLNRVDHHLTDKQSVFARFTFDQGSLAVPDTIPIDTNVIATRTRSATVQLVSIWSPKLLSTSRVGYNRTTLISDVALNFNYPADLFFFLDHRVPPQFILPGFTNFGPTSSTVSQRALNRYEFQEAFTYATGNHSFKFGFDYQHNGYNVGNGANTNPQYTWPSLAAFLQDQPLSGLTINVPGGTNERTFRQVVLGFYWNDDWKATPNLTVNWGVRFEPYTIPSEKWGRLPYVKDWLTATEFTVGGAAFKNPSLKYFAPRLGFAWSPGGAGKTAVRGAFGVFDRLYLPNDVQQTIASNPPFTEVIRTVIPGVTLANLPETLLRLAPSLISAKFSPQTALVLYPYNPPAQYEMKFNLAVERQVGPGVSVTLGYIGARGIHLTRQSEINGFYTVNVNGRVLVPLPAQRPNPAFGAGSIMSLDAQSFYNGLQLGVKKRLSRGFQLQASYTWAKAVDDSSTGVGGTDYSNQGYSSQIWNTKADRGLSALHQGQNLVVNGLWALPSPVGPRVVSYVLGGWQWSGIISVNTGAPFTVTESGTNVQDNGRVAGVSKLRMPDWIGTGSFSSIIRHGNPNQYFDSSAFVTPPPQVYGNLGRDTFLGPGLVNFDMSLQKNFALKFREGSQLEFRSDCFNLFNRANFAIPSATAAVNGNTGARIATAGAITNTVTSSRQLQFGLKLIF